MEDIPAEVLEKWKVSYFLSLSKCLSSESRLFKFF